MKFIGKCLLYFIALLVIAGLSIFFCTQGCFEGRTYQRMGFRKLPFIIPSLRGQMDHRFPRHLTIIVSLENVTFGRDGSPQLQWQSNFDIALKRRRRLAEPHAMSYHPARKEKQDAESLENCRPRRYRYSKADRLQLRVLWYACEDGNWRAVRSWRRRVSVVTRSR